MNKLLDRNIDLGLLILRVSVGFLMLLHGIAKIKNGVGFVEEQVVNAGLPAFVAYGVYIGEIIAPVFIIFGFATRFAAGILFIDCLMAIALVHFPTIFSLNEQGGWAHELIGLFLFGALTLVCTGGGRYALSYKYFWD